MAKKLEDSVAIVTGASRGIGKSICARFCEEGASVVGVARSGDTLRSSMDEVQKEDNQTLAVPADIQEPEEVERVVDETKDQFDAIDVLVNNAGINRDQLVLRMSEEDWEDVINTNLGGAFRFSKAVARQMMRERQGSIINISSVVGITGNAGQSNYSASKSGLHGFTKSLAQELGSRNIRVNAIAPGYIETEMTEEIGSEEKEKILEQTALDRLGTPEEVAGVTSFLASPDSRYITGQVLVVDGGMT